MRLDFKEDKPIYLQIAEEIEDGIFTGVFKEETQIPSTTEISVTFKINPATVLKGMNLLVDQNILYKQRGIGMFVSLGAYAAIKVKRQHEFTEKYIATLILEAKKLELTKEDIIRILDKEFK
jgi:DNA-binding transcriptional regulator YhcF (GntR family)